MGRMEGAATDSIVQVLDSTNNVIFYVDVPVALSQLMGFCTEREQAIARIYVAVAYVYQQWQQQHHSNSYATPATLTHTQYAYTTTIHFMTIKQIIAFGANASVSLELFVQAHTARIVVIVYTCIDVAAIL